MFSARKKSFNRNKGAVQDDNTDDDDDPDSCIIIFPIPPQFEVYNTPELAIEAINTLRRQHGYAVSILRSERNKRGDQYTVYICCDRGGDYRGRYIIYEARNQQQRLRKSSYLGIECPCTFVLRQQGHL